LIKEFLICYKKAFLDTINQDGIEHAGYLSFLSMLAIFPFMIIMTASFAFIVPWFLGGEEGAKLLIFMQNFLTNNEFTRALAPRLLEITSNPPDSFLGLALISIIWTASSLLEGIRTILNKAYRVTNPPSYLWRRLSSIVQFIIISSLFIFLLFLIKFLPFASNALLGVIVKDNNYPLIKNLLSWIIFLDNYLGTLVTLCATFLLLSYIYYLVPNKEQKFSHTFFGTFNTIVWWWLMGKAFKYYLSVFQQINLVYGSIAGVIIALLYFYICSIVFIYGAELNYWFSLILVEKKQKND
jgi:membrane protein